MEKVLVANRGEIAVRIIRTCRDIGVRVVAVFSEPDAGAQHVQLADEAVALTGTSARDTYLDGAAILAAVEASGADAVHPGYGFLAEDASFAAAVEATGATWIGPPAAAIAAMGDKIASRQAADAAGVAVVPGTATPLTDPEAVRAFAAEHGYPVAIKAARGGGGRGLRVVERDEDAAAALESAGREALAAFGDGTCYLERYLAWPRHVEVQLLADAHGAVVALGDRDCSSQRRHQKLLEESPAPDLPDDVRRGLADAAVRMAIAVGYRGAGTVEFLYEDGQFWFLEMNTRLQVEHPVTELVYGLDLVGAQIELAAGARLEVVVGGRAPAGHAIEVRINAEDPAGGRFLPSPGTISRLVVPGGFATRFDGGYQSGDTVSPYYDNLVGKLVVWAPDRSAAIGRARRALGELVVEGVATTAPVAAAILAHADFVAVRHSTRWVEEHPELSSVAPVPTAAVEPDAGSEAAREDVRVNGRWYRVPFMGDGRRDPAVPGAAAGRPRPSRSSDPSLAGGRAASASGSGSVVAPMQGTVVLVLVAVGDEVQAGEAVVVLEAMKMENRLVADRSGRVASVRVASGGSVAPGEVLVEIA